MVRVAVVHLGTQLNCCFMPRKSLATSRYGGFMTVPSVTTVTAVTLVPGGAWWCPVRGSPGGAVFAGGCPVVPGRARWCPANPEMHTQKPGKNRKKWRYRAEGAIFLQMDHLRTMEFGDFQHQ